MKEFLKQDGEETESSYGRSMMRYMLLIYSKETQMEQMSPEDSDKITSAHWAVMEETAKRGIFRGAEPLKPTATATTVRVQGGKPLITDGPFAETKEQLAGYYILDCKDLDEAISWAAKIPTACRGGDGCIEIRPLVPIPQPAQTGA
ncbi:MAG TPA: YciI family protein, partial [Candidatus Acidoferrales bacterium]|nr:YciI family protein [Candidatus Acidoferrales bacterium]